jgi:DDE superfamily endonuclease
MAFKHVSDEEKELIRKWSQEGKPPSQISKLLSRDLGTVCRQIAKSKSKKKTVSVGRPAALTQKVLDRLEVKVMQMTAAADAQYQITVAMIKKAAGLTCSDRTILRALHSRGIYMHPLREKPVRTTEDERERLAFAVQYADKPVAFWGSNVDAYLDNKFFPLYLNPATRAYAAKRVAKGTFRKKGEGLNKGHVKPRKNLKYNTGAPSLQISCAISATKVLMWHEVKGNWNAEQAVRMYRDKLAPALRSTHPSKRHFVVLEDNDPSGYKSKAAITAKAAEKVKVLCLPKRSPDLNPLDYGLWAEINKRMRRQEQKYATTKIESTQQYCARLRRTAMTLPASYLKPLVSSMKRRLADLRQAGGRDFQE